MSRNAQFSMITAQDTSVVRVSLLGTICLKWVLALEVVRVASISAKNNYFFCAVRGKLMKVELTNCDEYIN